MKSCCFTGHRQIPLAELAPLTAHLDAALADAYAAGCRAFYAGGAMGFDNLAAERTLLLRDSHSDVALYLLLPCRDQSNGWSMEEAARLYELRARCDGYRYVNEAYSSTAMYERNMALVASGELCIAYLRRYASGAGQTYRAAARAGLALINLADRFPAAEQPRSEITFFCGERFETHFSWRYSRKRAQEYREMRGDPYSRAGSRLHPAVPAHRRALYPRGAGGRYRFARSTDR